MPPSPAWQISKPWFCPRGHFDVFFQILPAGTSDSVWHTGSPGCPSGPPPWAYLLPFALWATIALEGPSPWAHPHQEGCTHRTVHSVHSAGGKQHPDVQNPGCRCRAPQPLTLPAFLPWLLLGFLPPTASGYRLHFLKNSLTMTTSAEAQEDPRCFFNPTVIQLEAGVGR